ncbi:hypothetical protein E1292_38645 [Nonomuraea deserti]|uniref:Core-binding (CB) domain-containing protein n=1 Tax=Nonomuraea deserti TaxID=1848322 RepID=A0A4R4UZI3_9ACTN|nr:hypothetical protein E1292_38645 [Nonomuraea deserti]
MIEQGLRLEEREGSWMLAGPSAGQFVLVDEYLAYLADRNYSPKTVRAYGYDLLAFCRWLRQRHDGVVLVTHAGRASRPPATEHPDRTRQRRHSSLGMLTPMQFENASTVA